MSDEETFHVEMDSHADDNTLTVSLSGDLDIADADWVEATLAAAAAHHSGVTIDLGGLDFIDSTGLRSLMALKQTATIRAINIHFANPSRAVSRLLEAAGLQSVLE